MSDNPDWWRPGIDELGNQWPMREHAVAITVDAPTMARYKELSEATRKAMEKHLVEQIFAPSIFDDMMADSRPPTWRETFAIYRERVHDAWLVLTGRANIGDGW